jgi:hypothetical protein
MGHSNASLSIVNYLAIGQRDALEDEFMFLLLCLSVKHFVMNMGNIWLSTSITREAHFIRPPATGEK